MLHSASGAFTIYWKIKLNACFSAHTNTFFVLNTQCSNGGLVLVIVNQRKVLADSFTRHMEAFISADSTDEEAEDTESIAATYGPN